MTRTSGILAAAILLPISVIAQTAVFDYSSVYERAAPAVVTVTTEDGSGSGFVVTPVGHIATNFHVIHDADYLAVQFASGVKVRAQVVAVNRSVDMALVKVHSAVIEGIEPLDLISESAEASLKVGVPVAAMGSPLNENFVMTQGILSKIGDGFVLGDYLLQPGSSGGPLLNRDGAVIGINTFGEGQIAGAIRIGPLREILASPLILDTVEVQPSPDVLPSLAPSGYPVAILNDKLNEPFDLEAYSFEAGDFVVTALTPVLLARLQRIGAGLRFPDGEEIDVEDEPFYAWQQTSDGALEMALRFHIQPKAELTTKSKWARALWPFMLGRAGSADMEFKGQFRSFRLYRDGEAIEPVTPGRHVITAVAAGGKTRSTYEGNYVYNPAEMLTGSSFRVEIIDGRSPEEAHIVIDFTEDSRLVRQVRSDFTYDPAVHTR